jgi:AMMECR1 domain-containing protein
LILESQGRRGLLLPQVPADYSLKTVPEFLRALCRKAGLPGDAWISQPARLDGFEVEECRETMAV